MNRLLLQLLTGLSLLLLLISCGETPQASPGEPAVRKFLERYFSTWSSQDMDGYAGCFHESARITLLSDHSGVTSTETLSDFLHSQRMSHKTADSPMLETAESMEIQADDRAALARVRWKLVKGKQTIFGIDHFSLVQTPVGWRIVHLLFYAD